MTISGKTRLFYMLADPIDHVRTPEVLNPLFAARGIDAVMVAAHFGADDYADAWQVLRRTRNLGGLVVSLPHKEQTFALCDQVEVAARRLRAVNVVRREADGRMIGANFDGAGFMKGMLNDGDDARGRRIQLVGAGGGGRAIAFSLAEAGFAALRISDSDGDRAHRVAGEVAAHFPSLTVTHGVVDLDVDLLINATPCGLHPDTDPLPVDVARLRRDMIVADIVMKPRDTPLLKAAAAAGCEIRHGDGMLDAQIELMVRFFGY